MVLARSNLHLVVDPSRIIPSYNCLLAPQLGITIHIGISLTPYSTLRHMCLLLPFLLFLANIVQHRSEIFRTGSLLAFITKDHILCRGFY